MISLVKLNGHRRVAEKRRIFVGAQDGSAGIPVSREDRVLVIAVHPDDESLGAGGLIQHALRIGARLRVVFVTDGDNNPWAQRFVERRLHIGASDRARWGRRRRGEAIAALSCLGVPKEDAEFWGFPDQGITAHLTKGSGELPRRLSNIVGAWKPTVVVGPSVDDLHPDHNSLAVLVGLVLAESSPARRRPRMLHYLVHAASGRMGPPASHIDLSPGQVAAKRRAILEHRTQMALGRGRFSAFALPTETFQAACVPDRPNAQHQGLTAEIAGDCIRITGGCIRRFSRLLLWAQGDGGRVARMVRIPLFGDAAVADAATGRALGKAAVLAGRTLVLPAGPFSGAKAIAIKRVDGLGIFDGTGWQQSEVRMQRRAEEKVAVVHPRVCCIIPCYNIEGVCGPVVDEAANYADMVIAVDDGSTDETGIRLSQAADRHPGKVKVLRFARNMGKGVVMIEAIRHALDSLEFDVLVTLDGDGQHRPGDIPRLARELVLGGNALVIGERLDREKMPLRSRFGNTLTALITRAFHPAAPTDTQSGFRAISPGFAREVVQRIKGGRYETELKILLLALTREYRIGSVTIPTVYIAGNRLSHFRPLVDSLKIYRILLSWKAEGPMDHAAAVSLDSRQ